MWNTVARLPADATSHAVTRLAPATTYRFIVRVGSNRGVADGGPFSLTTLGAAKPATGLTASNITQKAVDLAWTQPVQSSRVAVTGVEVQQQSGDSWATVATLVSNTTSHTVTGLTVGTAYSFRIRLVTSSGNADSEPASRATLAASATALTASFHGRRRCMTGPAASPSSFVSARTFRP